jgi:hypothetical protein
MKHVVNLIIVLTEIEAFINYKAMKNIMLSLLTALLFPCFIAAQSKQESGKDQPGTDKINKYSVPAEKHNPQIVPVDTLIFDKRYKQDIPDYSQNELNSLLKHYREDSLNRTFPGSSRYYAKRPLNESGYYDHFVKSPDTSAKYYLIIKNPLTNKITR